MENEEEPRITQIARITQIKKKKKKEEEEEEEEAKTAEDRRTPPRIVPPSALSQLSVLSAVLLRIWPFAFFPEDGGMLLPDEPLFLSSLLFSPCLRGNSLSC